MFKNFPPLLNLELFTMFCIKNIKNKDKLADYISYIHTCLILNCLLSFWYTDSRLHTLNIIGQLCTYTDWIYCAYNNQKIDCISTRLENIIRSEAVRERNSSKKALENKEKPRIKNGYIKTVIYDRLGIVVPEKVMDIIIHSVTGMSLFNSLHF